MNRKGMKKAWKRLNTSQKSLVDSQIHRDLPSVKPVKTLTVFSQVADYYQTVCV